MIWNYSCLIFCMIFEKKKFLLLYSSNWPNFVVWLPLILEIMHNVYCNCLLARLWCYKFWNELYLSNQAVSPVWLKSQDKNWNILRSKSFQDEIKSNFHHFKRAFIKTNKITFLESEGPTLIEHEKQFSWKTMYKMWWSN